MTYNTKERKLQIGVHEEVYLTKLEHELLICLSSNEITTLDEIKRYLNFFSNNNVRVLITQLRKKSKCQLHIKNINGRGYRLEDEIYFE